MFDEIRWAVTHVLRSSTRLQFLVADGVRFPYDLVRFLRGVVPLAATELAQIESTAQRIPDRALRNEAVASTQKKAYHVAGGCILATFLAKKRGREYVAVIAPLETIYDYLDNLCDRHPNVTSEAFPVLHEAIIDALSPHATPKEYYRAGPWINGVRANDAGYLRSLVRRTQDALQNIEGYEALLPMFGQAATLYGEMQTFKHLAPGEREKACIAWYERNDYRDISWYEFACAAGSQLQVYAPLFMLMQRYSPEIMRATYSAYFPAVAALHVLLDAFIDQAEDREHGELNFATCYPSFTVMRDRVKALVERAYVGFAALPDPYHHRFVLRVMALFYLTHPKVSEQNLDEQARRLLACF